MYHFVVTLARLPQLVQRPDPARPIEGNRKVDPRHAEDFSTYVLENDSWVAPSIIVRAPSAEIEFKAAQEFDDGTSWGVLEIPLHVLTEILILDGQHRTLGIFIAIDRTNKEIARLVDLIQKADQNGDLRLKTTYEQALEQQKRVRAKLGREHLSVDLALVSNEDARMLFVDINNNLKGVNKDFTTVLNQRDVMNRIARALIETHPLLLDRVETGQAARMSSRNRNLLGAKQVADIARAVFVGSGRLSARREKELEENEGAALQTASEFFTILLESFDDFAAVVEGEIDPLSLRERSMLGSGTMLRVLAAVYFELTEGGGSHVPRSEIRGYFRSLSAPMREIPIAEDNDFWMSTRAFLVGTSAPMARSERITSLVKTLADRARDFAGGRAAE
jgi:DGQHR domain-containing protein